MAAQGNQVPTITLYMPEAVLAMRAESARKQFTAYEPTEEDKRQSLMIVAQGYAGTTIRKGVLQSRVLSCSPILQAAL